MLKFCIPKNNVCTYVHTTTNIILYKFTKSHTVHTNVITLSVHMIAPVTAQVESSVQHCIKVYESHCGMEALQITLTCQQGLIESLNFQTVKWCCWIRKQECELK